MKFRSKGLMLALATLAFVWLMGITMVNQAKAQAQGQGKAAAPAKAAPVAAAKGPTAGEFYKNVSTSTLKGLTPSDFLGAMGVPYALVLGSAGGMLEFIPVVGPLAAGLIIVSVALLTSFPHWAALVIFLAVWRLIQDYVSSPRIMGESMELHPLAAIFGVMAGAEVAGILGIYLSIPVMASLRIVFRRWRLYAEKKKFGPLTELPLRAHETHRP